MLLRFKIQNFLSFYKETSFDMFPNTKREKLLHHIYNEEVPLLKQAAIYGQMGQVNPILSRPYAFFVIL